MNWAKIRSLRVKTEHVPAGAEETVFCISGFCMYILHSAYLAQIPDIYRCICSNRDMLGFFTRRFRLFLVWVECIKEHILVGLSIHSYTYICYIYVPHTVPKVIDFPWNNTKCREENEILCGIFRLVSRFPQHFVLYLGNFAYLLDSALGIVGPILFLDGQLEPWNSSPPIQIWVGQFWYKYVNKKTFSPDRNVKNSFAALTFQDLEEFDNKKILFYPSIQFKFALFFIYVISDGT